jgi:dipeptidyl aminopeptidase/acylaminoacyl peptidase
VVERAPYGTWRSPITAASIVGGASTIAEVVVDGTTDDAPVWFSEARPAERGRVAIMRANDDGTADEITPPDASARTRVHEYGGGAWWVQNNRLYYGDLADQQLRVVAPDQPVRLLTFDQRDRYADLRVSPDDQWLVCVRERHEPDTEATNAIVALALDESGVVNVLAGEADFVSNPRISPDGTRLAWIQWFHPNMPWDSTELWVAAFSAGTISEPQCLARDAALLQPEWSPDGALHVVSDRSGWWSIERVADGAVLAGGARDWGEPPWVFGMSTYAFRSDGSLVTLADVETVLSDVTCLRTRGSLVVAAGATWTHETQVVELAVDGSSRQLRAPRDHHLDPEFCAPPEHITFATGDGAATAHAWFYAPANPAFAGPEGERPPLIVMAHGGPTSAAQTSLRLQTRYWTSRGFAVVDVDYRGSTGYGRAYRRALDAKWGIADVEDCVAAAQFLAARGDVDAQQLFIRGGSAGGYTVLCACTFHHVFAAGASHYGVADLEALATDTHKFESRYLDRLVGPYPEARELYVERSPIHHTDLLGTPMIVLQGLDDLVVPPNQAEMLVAALEAKGVPHAYVAFAGEGHGFRKAENIIAALEAELSFYGQMSGFVPADPIAPVPIRSARA